MRKRKASTITNTDGRVGAGNPYSKPRPHELWEPCVTPLSCVAPELVDQKAVEAHLFGAFIPACYRATSGWTAYEVQPWLAFPGRTTYRPPSGGTLIPGVVAVAAVLNTPFVDGGHERSPSSAAGREAPLCVRQCQPVAYA